MTTKPLTTEQLQLLMTAAGNAGLRVQDLKPVNPWALSTPQSHSLQMAVQALNPTMAQQLMEEAEVPLSLAAAAYEAGAVELNAEIMAELKMKRPATAARIRAEQLKAQEEAFKDTLARRAEERAGHKASLDAQLEGDRIRSLQLLQAHARQGQG